MLTYYSPQPLTPSQVPFQNLNSFHQRLLYYPRAPFPIKFVASRQEHDRRTYVSVTFIGNMNL